MTEHKDISQLKRMLNCSINHMVLDDHPLRYTVRRAKVNIYVNRYRKCA